VTQHAAAAALAAQPGTGSGAVELQRLLASGRLSRAAGLARVTSAAKRTVEASADRTLPVRAELRPLLPGKGLRRGATITVAHATEGLHATATSRIDGHPAPSNEINTFGSLLGGLLRKHAGSVRPGARVGPR
jgi:hypothetical protein